MSESHFRGSAKPARSKNKQNFDRQNIGHGVSDEIDSTSCSFRENVAGTSTERSSSTETSDGSSGTEIPHNVYISELYKCQLCGYKYLLGKYLDVHKAMHKSDISSADDIFELISSVKLFECVVCGVKKQEIEGLKSHIERAHPMKTVDKVQKVSSKTDGLAKGIADQIQHSALKKAEVVGESSVMAADRTERTKETEKTERTKENDVPVDSQPFLNIITEAPPNAVAQAVSGDNLLVLPKINAQKTLNINTHALSKNNTKETTIIVTQEISNVNTKNMVNTKATTNNNTETSRNIQASSNAIIQDSPKEGTQPVQSKHNHELEENFNETKSAKQSNVVLPVQNNPNQPYSTLIAIKVYNCSVCGASDIMEPNLEKHFSKVHGQTSIPANIFQVNGVTWRDKCDICKKYLKKGGLKSHKLRLHSQIRGDRTDISQYIAQIEYAPMAHQQRWTDKSDRVYVNKRENKTEGTSNIYKCLICNVDGIKEKDLTKHLFSKSHKTKQMTSSQKMAKIFELTTTRMECEVCHKVFTKKRLAKHIRNEHKKERTTAATVDLYECGICDVYGILDGKMKQHHLMKHGNIPIGRNKFKLCAIKSNMSCQFCGKRAKEGHLDKHQLKICLQAKLKKTEHKKAMLREMKRKQVHIREHVEHSEVGGGPIDVQTKK